MSDPDGQGQPDGASSPQLDQTSAAAWSSIQSSTERPSILGDSPASGGEILRTCLVVSLAYVL